MNHNLHFERTMQSLKLKHEIPEHLDMLSKFLAVRFDQIDQNRELVFLCIGTDRSTGDSLGPLVGTQLKRIHHSGFHVFGTLEEPVHALNLEQQLTTISHLFCNPFIIAIDACLGQSTSVGCIQIGDGPIKPGAGVHKQLPAVGDIHITGIVNISGFMEYFVLQNTRLFQVYRMSESIAKLINRSLRNSVRKPNIMFSQINEM